MKNWFPPAIGALMDEYERVALELKNLLTQLRKKNLSKSATL